MQSIEAQKEAQDQDARDYLAQLEERERTKANHVPGVQKVLVVLSTTGLVFDTESLRQMILYAYPEAAVFFRTTSGKALGVEAPKQVDLLIDLTGPGQRSPLLYAYRLKGMARFSVGRNAGLFRARIYDRVYDEKPILSRLPRNTLDRERVVQREVLALAGVAMIAMAHATPDRGKEIALDLPPLSRT